VIVLVMTAVPPGLRGDLSRWLLEISPGVFTGRVSRRVRERLWRKARFGVLQGGSAIMVVADRSREQGFEILTAGTARWEAADFEGLTLMRRRSPRRQP
jgi:CRISPR-associated protein Cas2